MGNGHSGFCRGQRTGQRRVRIPNHDRHTRTIRQDPLFRRYENRRRLFPMRRGSNAEILIRRVDPELLVVHLVQRIVVVLTGIDRDHRCRRRKRIPQDARLDHLGTGPKEQSDHQRTSGRSTFTKRRYTAR